MLWGRVLSDRRHDPDEDLCWRVEEACLNAWPSPRQIILNGWMLRASGGPTRRTDSVNPLRWGSRDPAEVLAAADAIYSALGQPTLFRVPTIAAGMEEALKGLGFAGPEAQTLTLLCDFAPPAAYQAGPAISASRHANRAWLEARHTFTEADAVGRRTYDAMIASLLGQTRFSAAIEGEAIASVAYGVVQSGLLVIESVATRPSARGRGLATAVAGDLLEWGRSVGAKAACLQAVAANAQAISVYQRLGFTRELYRYHYRRRA